MAGALDLLLTIPTVVVTAMIGRPLPSLDCGVLSPSNANTATAVITNGSTFTALYTSSPVDSASAATRLPRRRHILAREVDYAGYVVVDQPHCFEAKAVWGLEIALCVLFGVSPLVCVGLWRRARVSGGAKSVSADDSSVGDAES